MNTQTERTWAEISPENILHNMRAIRASLPDGTKFLGVVKANAYGHGAVTVARALEENGADYLAVACLPEAIELREAGARMPILILGVTPPEDTAQLLRYDITQSAADAGSAAAVPVPVMPVYIEYMEEAFDAFRAMEGPAEAGVSFPSSS